MHATTAKQFADGMHGYRIFVPVATMFFDKIAV